MVVLKSLLKRWNKKWSGRMYLLFEQGWSFCWRAVWILTVATVMLVTSCKFVKCFSDLFCVLLKCCCCNWIFNLGKLSQAVLVKLIWLFAGQTTRKSLKGFGQATGEQTSKQLLSKTLESNKCDEGGLFSTMIVTMIQQRVAAPAGP